MSRQNRMIIQISTRKIINISTRMAMFIIIVCLCQINMFQSIIYRIPSLIQQNTITVPIIDPCRFFQIENSTLFRMGQSNTISRWDLTTMTYNEQNAYQSLTWTYNVANLAIGKYTNQLVVPLANTTNFNILTAQNILYSSNHTIITLSSGYYLSKVQSTSLQYLVLLSSNTSLNSFKIYSKTLSIISSITLNFSGPMNSTLSQDQNTIILYNYQGYALMYCRTTSWGFCGWVSPPATSQTMNGVTLSNNGSIALFEYDSVLIGWFGLMVVKIIPFQNVSLLSSLTFTNTIINQAIFMDSDCHLLALTINYTNFQIYDTLTLTLKSSTNLVSLSNYSAIDYSLGKLYLCLQQGIQTYEIYCPGLTYRSSLTNQCIDCVLQNNCLGCDQATGFCNSCQTNFTLNTTSFVCEISNFNINSSNITNLTSLTNLNNTNITNSNFTSPTNMNSTNSLSRNLSSFGNYTNSSNYSTTISNNSYIGDVSTVESRIVNFETSGLENISPIIGFIYMILQMSPFAILFLSFINYWNFCCLYSILDIKVPLYLPNAHQIIFNSTQTSIFTVLNYNPSLPVLENQNVQQNFAVNYQISLDFINTYYQNIIIVLFVLTLVCLAILLRNLLISKETFLFKCLKFSLLQSILGQLITFSPFCIIPYKFLIKTTGYIQFSRKQNLFLQSLLLIWCFSVVSLFIWKRLSQNSKMKCQTQEKQHKKGDIQIEQNKRKQSNVQFQHELLMVVANITVPFLIILPIYLPFFIVNLILFLYGIRKAVQLQKYKINSIITSCYLPLYHTCYFILYLFNDYQNIVHYTGMLCLTLLLLGGIHELLNLIIISSIQVVFWIIKTFKKSKIQAQKKEDIFLFISTPINIQKRSSLNKLKKTKKYFIKQIQHKQKQVLTFDSQIHNNERIQTKQNNSVSKTCRIKKIKAVINHFQVKNNQSKRASSQFFEQNHVNQESFNRKNKWNEEQIKYFKRMNIQMKPSNNEKKNSFFHAQYRIKRKQQIDIIDLTSKYQINNFVPRLGNGYTKQQFNKFLQMDLRRRKKQTHKNIVKFTLS